MIGKDLLRRKLTAIAFGLALLQFVSTSVMAAGPGVHGRVLGHDEQGTLLGIVAGAKIQFETSSGGKVAQTTSDGNGYYKVDLPAGEYIYKIESPGYRKEDRGRGLRLSQSQGYAIFNLSLTKGMDDPKRKPPEIPVKKGGKLAGRVLEKTPKGLVGIPDARILLRREGTPSLSPAHSRATSDGQHDVGDYEVSLETGTFHASVIAAGFEKLIDPAAIEIKADQETKRDFILSRIRKPEPSGQGIRGVVTFVDSESPPPAIHVQIAPLGDANRAAIDATPTSSGAFKQALSPGRYRVTASAEGYPTASSPPIYVLEDRFAVANLTLRAKRVPEPKTTIEAFVFTKSPRGSEPLPGARVFLQKAGAAAESAVQATSDSTGHVFFPVTEAGDYAVSASLKDYRPGSGKGSVEAGKNHEIEIELTKESGPLPLQLSLEVRVNDSATSQPLAGATVLARHESESLAEAAHGATDGQGVLQLNVKKSGNYTVLAQNAGYVPGGANTSVTAGGANQVTIALKPFRPSNRPEQGTDQPRPPREPRVASPQPITGFVAYREQSGQLKGVANVKLIWDRIAPANPPISNFATTTGNGQYEIDVLTGVFQVRILPSSGFKQSMEQVEVLPETHEKYFIIQPIKPQLPEDVHKLPVEGSVVTSDTAGRFAGVVGAEVLFSDARNAERTGTDRTGRFTTGMAAGGYRVQVRAPGFEPLETRVDLRPDMQPLRFVLKRMEPSQTAFNLNLSVVERGRMGGSMRAVANAKVHVSVDGNAAGSGVSDVAGQYSAKLNPGTYSVRVDKPGYATATARIVIANRDAIEQIVLVRREEPGAETGQKANLTVRASQRVARTQAIRPATGPLAGANVVVMLGAKPVATGVTNSAGVFSTPIAAGNYSVKVEAQGFAPAGKTIAIGDRDAVLEFELSSRLAPSEDTTPQVRIPPLPRDDFGRLRDGSNAPADVRYVAEYRLKGQTRWTTLATKSSERDANSALHLAMDRGQIPNSAETRVRVEKGVATPDLRFSPGLRKF